MSNGPEGSFWGSEQLPPAEITPQTSEARRNIVSFRDNAIERARDGFVGSVESGKAQEVAGRAIDIAAKTAETSLNGLPPGTRMVGKFVGRRLIGRLQEGAHNRIDETLTQAVDLLAVPVTPDYSRPALESSGFGSFGSTAPAETGGWGVPPAIGAEGGYKGFTLPSVPAAESGGWGTASTAGAEPVITPEAGGWGAPIPPSTENSWWTDPNAQPVVEIPAAKKESLFKRMKGKSAATPTESVEPAIEPNGWAIPPAPNNPAAGSWW
jgi:hypothetical protein